MDLIALKVSGASVVAILVVLQALIMLQVYTRGRVFSLPLSALMRWHRSQGYALLVFIVLITFACVTRTSVNWHDPRVAAHAVSGMILIAGLFLKILSIRAFPRARRVVPVLGLVLVLAAVVAVGSTVPWYFFMWLVRGIRLVY
jgi:hypothetical protein